MYVMGRNTTECKQPMTKTPDQVSTDREPAGVVTLSATQSEWQPYAILILAIEATAMLATIAQIWMQLHSQR